MDMYRSGPKREYDFGSYNLMYRNGHVPNWPWGRASSVHVHFGTGGGPFRYSPISVHELAVHAESDCTTSVQEDGPFRAVGAWFGFVSSFNDAISCILI